ncbi:MAG: AsmA-like C-terminal region-containing protein [Pikeienuella sp.]|uniref:AsmA-like C-terminal region-containing protein n=1 Tax=Pikeienuella sp. TaxID=2831957 RepID=UPI00391C9753
MNEGEAKGGRAPARRGPLLRLGRLAAALASGALLLSLVLVAGLWFRLAVGPLDLSFLAPVIEREASARTPGAHVEIGSARLALLPREEGGGAAVALSGVTLIDDETGPFAVVPEISARFALRSLLEGRFTPDDVALTGISGRLVRDASGAFRFGFGGLKEDEEGEGAAAFARLVAAISAETGPAAASPLPAEPEGRVRLRLADASILYLDRFAGRAYRAEGADIRFRFAGESVGVRAEATLAGGAHGRVALSLRGWRAPSGAVRMSAAFENAAPADIAGQIVALDWMAAFDAPVGGKIDLEMDAAGTLTALSGRLEAGAGKVALGGGAVEPLERAALDFVFDPAAERFEIGEVSLASDRAAFTGAGFVQVGRDEAEEPLDVVAQLDLSDIRVSAPELLDAPLPYRAARLTGRITLDPLLIEIGELRLERERMSLSAAGRLWPEAGGWRTDMVLGGADISLAEMLEHWPREAAPGALLWMRENMEAATVTEADAVLRLGGEAEEVKIDFTFKDTVGHYLRPMPPILGGVGSGQVDLQRFSLALDSGHVTPTGGAALDLAGSTFVIADLNHPDTPGEARIRAKGRVADALALIDEEPLGLTSQLGVPLGDVAGEAAIEAVSTFPLLKDLLLEDVAAAATAMMTDVALVAPGLEREVTAAALTLEASTAGFLLSGDVVAAGLPAAVEWREVFSPAARSITARAEATPERIAEFGISQGWFTAGTIPVTATIEPGGAGARFAVSADLAGGALAIPEIGWTKGRGDAGALSAAGEIAGARLRLDRFEIEAPGLSAAGAAETDAAGAPERVELSRFRFREAVDLALSARRTEDRWRIAAEGPLLDLTRLEDLLDDAMSDGAAGDAAPERGAAVAPFRIDAKIGRLVVTETQSFTDVSGNFRRTARDAVIAEGEARVAGGARVVADFRRGPEGGRLTLDIADAGGFLRGAKVFDDGAGGALKLNARIEKGEPFRLAGMVRVDDIVIHEDAKLEALLAGAELSDLRATMREEGIVFRRIRAPFAYGEERLTLKDATATGPSIGVNISGDYLLAEDRLDMDGVFTPLYGLNSAVGAIPVIGTILTGGKGQGVFAVTFSVSGPAGDPDVSVNPLSALTPGILRRIFEGGGTDDASLTLDGAEPAPRVGR